MLMDILDFALILVVSLLGVFFIVTLIAWTRVIGWLKEKHFTKWDELGRLSFTNIPIRKSLSMISFLRTREFLVLNDIELTKRCTALRGLLCMYIVVFGITLIVVLIFIIENPK